jgi:hypothetical protein
VTWTATDAAGNSASATQTVTVSDTTAPTLTAPADVTVEAAGLQTVVELGAATATDSVDPDPTVTSDAPATFSLGSTVVTWTATDAAGNSASATQTVTVIPRPITVTAIPKSKTYGDPDPPLTYEITAGSLVAPDTIAGALSRAAGENVGAHAILQGTLTLGSSYALTYIGADLTINPRPATVTAGSGTKVYSDPDPLLLTTGAGFLPDDVAGIALLTIRVSGEAVGTYPTAATATGGQVGNYAVTYIAGTFTIQGAYVNKTNVLLEMQALRATVTEKEDGKKLDEAIERLEKSLDPKLWATPPDGVRLDPKDGEKVIELEKQAAEKLLQLIRSKKSALSDAVLQDWVDRMRMTSRLLATVAISDAVEADGDNKKIEEANKKLDEGDKKALENKGDAIEHYKTAWKQAQEALEKK